MTDPTSEDTARWIAQVEKDIEAVRAELQHVRIHMMSPTPSGPVKPRPQARAIPVQMCGTCGNIAGGTAWFSGKCGACVNWVPAVALVIPSA